LTFLVLSAGTETAPPFAVVDVLYGPPGQIDRRDQARAKPSLWWQLEIRTNAEPGTIPLCMMRALTDADPLGARQPLRFARYQLKVPETGETLEYVDIHSGRALLPAWGGWEKYFVPHPSPASRRQDGAPQTCGFLGHVLTLVRVGHDEDWKAWPDVKQLVLDREVLVRTGRNFKDVEGWRLPQTPQPQEYSYTNFTAADYQTMFAAGMNLFTVAPGQQQYVQAEPVFYLRSAAGTPAVRYPADLYRANFLGTGMFVDEPASILTWDKYVGQNLTRFSDAATLIEERTRATFDSDHPYYGRYGLERQLLNLGINFGSMRFAQAELPIWETFYDTAFYEMKGGGSGIVHEGRYHLREFDEAVARVTGEERAHTTREMFQWYYAALRGGTRPFGKFWGTSIYGQCDPAIAPEAFTTAYDMGARYFWFWTSDHGHHVPWPEQLALARSLRQYAQAHPRPSIYAPQPKRDTLILIPNGYFATFDNLWWVHSLDLEGKNEESQKYQRLLRRVVKAVHECFKRGADFDLAPDDGRAMTGYRRVVRISERE
jgi:hypothetical protein